LLQAATYRIRAASLNRDLSLFVWLLLPLLALVLLIDLATMGTERRAQMLRRSGLSQAAIAQRLGVSRYRVRLALA
jgi:hypothetical protein